MNKFNGEQGEDLSGQSDQARSNDSVCRRSIVSRTGLFLGVIGFLSLHLFSSANLFPSEGQVPEYYVKAMLLRQCSQFVGWPEEAGLDDPTKPFVIAVYGKNPFGKYLDTYTGRRGKRINGKKVEIRYIKKIEEIPGCHLLFISELSKRNLLKVLEFTGDKPILTVGDTSGYAGRGVHINLFIKGANLRLEINETAAREANLLLGSNLLNPDDKGIILINPYIPYQAKALHIREFIPFVTWPPESGMNDPSKPFNITVIGKNPFESYLEYTFKEKRIMNKKVNIRIITNVNQIGNTHLLFISTVKKDELAQILDYTRNKPILTIGDSEGFYTQGIHINFFYDRVKLCFEINNDAIKQAKLDIDYHLQKLAKKKPIVF